MTQAIAYLYLQLKEPDYAIKTINKIPNSNEYLDLILLKLLSFVQTEKKFEDYHEVKNCFFFFYHF